MKLTNRSEYALLAMVHLSKLPPANTAHAKEIAEAQDIPLRFLQQILLTLKRARYVRSRQGSQGGYELARPAAEISLAEIVRLFDGALAATSSVSKNFYEPSPIEKEQKLLALFQEIRDFTSQRLEQTSLADL